MDADELLERLREEPQRAAIILDVDGVLAPIVLGYMLIQRIVTPIVDGYADMPGWYLLAIGWGTIAFIVVVAVVLPLLRWRRSPDDFTSWPPFPPEASAPASRSDRTEVSS